MTIAEQVIPAGSWTADELHSSVRFEIEHMGVSAFRAGFTRFDAGLDSEGDAVVLWGVVSVASFDVHDDALRPHVMSPDFLDVGRFPELRFRSCALRRTSDEVVVDGELTIKGASRRVEARGRIAEPITDPYGNRRFALALEATIDRTEFGIGWQMRLPGGGRALASDVKLVVSLEFVKQP
jgi:polyisoprenoid-binding protein YceI